MKAAAGITLGRPDASDGASVWQLVKESGTLDLNSAYCYIMLCDLFRDSCVVAKQDGVTVGFLSACRMPASPDTLFVWQVAVSGGQRGKGIGTAMLQELLDREELGDIRYVEATIGPENDRSRRLFMSLAARRGGQCSVSERYPANLFPQGQGAHEPELAFRVGPLRRPGEPARG
ncbi:diaminobutyrate acetyltransferase [Paenibacillus humicola]|uniref:diaminobutyrate acetyltransferase n=1 Tax=Paenibacillus humicola TaxID=3110540 RepID=UPI00237A6112|nr:diaminobutyrate acetyltransferase [Paenibacillus humicola]